MSADTTQLQFWRGTFGDAYTERNSATAEQLRARVAMWARILRASTGISPASILEVGANIGNNLRALTALTGAVLYAVEPNEEARRKLAADGVLPAENIRNGCATALDFADASIDLVFTSGVLIHVAPDDLLQSCREIHRVARHSIVCVEYFSNQPQEISYRGHSGVLFKRDFGSFWLDHFADLRLRDYGFFWKRATGLDNLTWWAFEKCA
jgi:pseudaminic acid biosynthesis-associated methylase